MPAIAVTFRRLPSIIPGTSFLLPTPPTLAVVHIDHVRSLSVCLAVGLPVCVHVSVVVCLGRQALRARSP